MKTLAFLTLAAGVAAAPLSRQEIDTAIEKFGALEEVVRAARDELPRADLELEERALAAEMDPEALVAWVRDAVRFDPYPGVLRGPRGALRARAGNAWDQALLTAALLRTSGLQARVVHAELTPAQAARLLAGLTADAPEFAAPPADAVGALGAELGALSGRDAAAREAAAAGYRDRIGAASRALAGEAGARLGEVNAALSGAGFAFADDRAAWVEEARDYAWVEYRRAQGDPWRAAHPAFGAGAAPTLTPAGWVEGAAPKDRLFEIEVTLTAEIARDGELEAKGLMSRWRKPAANLAGLGVTLTLSGDGFRTPTDAGDPDAGWARTRFLVPFLGGAPAPHAKALDLRGFVLSPDVAASGMAQVFSTVGDRTLGAIDALGAAASEKGPGAQELTAVWVDLTVHRPGGTRVRHRRYLLDRVGAAERAKGRADAVRPMSPAAIAAALHRQLELVVLTGDETPYAALDAALEFRAETLADLPATLRPLGEAEPSRRLPASLVGRRDPRGAVLAAAVGAAGRAGDARVFRHGPGVFLFHRTLVAGGGVREQLDVVRSPRRGLRATPDGWSPAPDAVLAAGVRETVAEKSRPHPPAMVTATSAADALAGAALTLVREPGDLAALDLPAAARENLAADLGRGFAALLKPGPEPAWWRVDPTTGEATGVTADGAGSATVEYLEVLSVGINMGFTAYGVSQCETPCCAATTILMGTTLTIGGLAIGADLAGKAAIAFLAIMDVGVNSATTVLVPPPCNG